jgi:hypothetical protein
VTEGFADKSMIDNLVQEILVDHAAEYFLALHWRVRQYDSRLVMAGWLLIP